MIGDLAHILILHDWKCNTIVFFINFVFSLSLLRLASYGWGFALLWVTVRSIAGQVVAFLLIGVAAYGETASIIKSLPVVGGIVACGVLLFLVAGLGLVGAAKHHQVSDASL